jgi:hypothetical protein
MASFGPFISQEARFVDVESWLLRQQLLVGVL